MRDRLPHVLGCPVHLQKFNTRVTGAEINDLSVRVGSLERTKPI